MTGITALLVGQGADRLTVNANTASGSNSGSAFSGPVTTGTPGTTASGGIAPYTYAWEYRSGSSVPILSGSFTDQNPTWGNSDTPDGISAATWRVTATDSVGSTAFRDITVQLTWISLL